MLPDDRVARFVNDNFVPVKVHVREQREDFRRLGDRYGAHWTPTLVEIDPEGVPQHRIEGFLPAEELIAQLELGLAHAAFKRGDFAEAARRFQDVSDRFAATDSAPEATYWAGVSRYKDTDDGEELIRTAEEFTRRYQDSTWAKKASVWAKARVQREP